MPEQPTEEDWTVRHARTRPSERSTPVVRIEAEADDWARRHSETSR